MATPCEDTATLELKQQLGMDPTDSTLWGKAEIEACFTKIAAIIQKKDADEIADIRVEFREKFKKALIKLREEREL